DEIKHIKKFIASAGTYANLVRQAKSRQKILDKMEADGFIQPVHQDRVFTFRFADVEKLPLYAPKIVPLWRVLGSRVV
ncbi:MAG: hypothetical protein EOP70_08660, partial [Variovorax sp.]